jgi:glycosyltransferase involved in cell wall biosynthesis
LGGVRAREGDSRLKTISAMLVERASPFDPDPKSASQTSGDSREPPRICIATSIHPDYDARVFRHAISVARAGYTVDLVCPWQPPTVKTPSNLRIVHFPRVSRRAFRPVLIPARMLRLLLAEQYDLYHFHDLDLLPLMAILKLAIRKPVVYDCHENYAEEMLSRNYPIPDWSRHWLAAIVKWAERISAAVIREVVIVVPQQERTFPGPWFRTNLVRNYAGLEVQRGYNSNLADRPDACISTASQYITNGALFMVEIAREVVRRRPHVKFYAIDRFGSDAELRNKLLASVSASNLDDNFVLLPNVPPHSIMSNLNRATVGLSVTLPTPNHIAALPTKLVEYMAGGLAIVAADFPNIRRLIEETGSGVLAIPGNALSFADCICDLIDNKARRLELAENGLRAFHDSHNWEAEVKKTLALYERLLKE